MKRLNRWRYRMRRKLARFRENRVLDDPRHPLNQPSPLVGLFGGISHEKAVQAWKEKYGELTDARNHGQGGP